MKKLASVLVVILTIAFIFSGFAFAEAADTVVIYIPGTSPDIGDWDNNVILQKIEEATNTDIQLVYIDQASQNDQLTAAATSGAFPDIACVVSHTAKKMLQSWADNNVIAPFEGDIAAAAPNVIAQYETNPNLTEIKVNGKIYMQPVGWGDGNDPNMGIIHVRKDLLDKFGMDVPDTWDAYVEYLRKCVNDEKISGVVFVGDNTRQQIQSCMNANLGAYGIPYYGWTKTDNGYEYWMMHPDSVKAVLDIRRIVEEGLVDPGVWGMTEDECRAMFVSGTAGSLIYNAGGHIGRIQNDMAMVNPELQEWVLPALDFGGPTRGYTQEPMFWGGTVIGAGENNNPVAAARVINYLVSDEGYELTAIGIEGRDYVKEGDELVMLEERFQDGFPTEAGLNGAHPLASGLVSWQPMEWQDFSLLYGKDQAYSEWYQAMRKNQCDYQTPAYGLTATSPLWSNFEPTSSDLIARALVSVYRAKTDEEATAIWTKLQADWLAAGGEAATAEMSQTLAELYD